MDDRRAEVFVLRIAAAGTGDGAEWHGRVEHVRSGAATTFRSLDEMGNFIAACTPPPLDGSPPSPISEPGFMPSETQTGNGNYTEERDQLFGQMTVDEIVAEIKRSRER